MTETYQLRFGADIVPFRMSDTQVAVTPRIGRARDLDVALESLTRRTRAERRGRLGRFEIIDIEAMPADVANERARLDRTLTVQQQTPVYHTSDDDVPFVPEGSIYLAFRDGTSDEAINELFLRYDFALARVDRHGYYTVYTAARDTDALQVAMRLQNEAIVAVAEPDLVTRLSYLQFMPSDALLARQWHLENKGEFEGKTAGFIKGADARVVAAWQRLGNLGSADPIIAIIDDGFDADHPDFKDKFVQPWDFIRGNGDVKPEPGNWHGTACAGVAAGLSGGGDIVGAAPNARIMPLRMTDSLSSLHVEQWFKYVTDKGAWVVSCSWNADAKVYPLGDRVSNAITQCATGGRDGKGCVVAFAAGNSGRDVNDPPNSQNGFAVHPKVLAVAASTSLDHRASYSETGAEIAVCAPSAGFGGWGIATADVTGTYVDNDGITRSSGYDAGNYHLAFTGTSSSCPLVAGVCALVLGANPALSADEVRRIIRATAREIGKQSDYQNGHSRHFGHGCVDADAAVAMAIEVRDRGGVPIG